MIQGAGEPVQVSGTRSRHARHRGARSLPVSIVLAGIAISGIGRIAADRPRLEMPAASRGIPDGLATCIAPK